jgi:hypothetical protein
MGRTSWFAAIDDATESIAKNLRTALSWSKLALDQQSKHLEQSRLPKKAASLIQSSICSHRAAKDLLKSHCENQSKIDGIVCALRYRC